MIYEQFILIIIMSFGDILFEHSADTRKTIRAIESINKKLINAKAAFSFNDHCIRNSLLPAFTNIYIYIYIRVVLKFIF